MDNIDDIIAREGQRLQRNQLLLTASESVVLLSAKERTLRHIPTTEDEWHKPQGLLLGDIDIPTAARQRRELTFIRSGVIETMFLALNLSHPTLYVPYNREQGDFLGCAALPDINEEGITVSDPAIVIIKPEGEIINSGIIDGKEVKLTDIFRATFLMGGPEAHFHTPPENLFGDFRFPTPGKEGK